MSSHKRTLSDEIKLDFPENKNPHTLQSKKSEQDSQKEFSPILRQITDESPREKYHRRFNDDKTTFKFGQRKLMLSEIEFLSIVTNEINELKKCVLIYAGAAPGIHIASLMNMFPYMEYVLIDPAKFIFDEKKPITKFEIINDFFTDELAIKFSEKYSNYEIIFISDIRSADHRLMTNEQTELQVETDMINQMKWHEIMRPFKSMLKFRLPYVGDRVVAKKEIEYLDGKVYLQMWEGKTSSETRLIVDRDARKKNYDCEKYEDQLFRFNTVERVMCYSHEYNTPGIDHCFDCRSEIFILEEYLKSQKIINKICSIKGIKAYYDFKSVFELEELLNKELNAFRKTGGLKLTINGKTNMYCCAFTDIYYGADLRKIFSPDKIVKSKFVKTNSSDEEDNIDLNEIKNSDSVSLHCLQNKKITKKNFNSESRYLSESFPERARPKYMNKSDDRTTLYFKERGLRLAEIEFLTLACKEIAESSSLRFKPIVLVYAGAAPSVKLNILHGMFPFIKFLLYDPDRFSDTKTSSMIEIKREYFDESIALDIKYEYKDYVILFISNIKKGDKRNSFEFNVLEKKDMQLQKNCLQIMKPFKSLLRFRIPFPDVRTQTTHEIEYYDGKILFPLWSNFFAAEAFLLVSNEAQTKKYNYLKFLNQMYRFNTLERVECYEHSVVCDGLDHCYDCRSEVFIFEMFKANYEKIYKSQKEEKLIKKFRDKSLSDFSDELNALTNAYERFFFVKINQEDFRFRFTDAKYGKKLNQVFFNSADQYRDKKELTNRLDFRSKIQKK